LADRSQGRADAPGGPVWQAVEEILERRRPLAVAVTGGGSRALTWLFNHPGASRSLVDGAIPYHEAAIADYIGLPGPHRVGDETARRLSSRARDRAGRWGGDGACGLGATAALATDRERRGEDRAWAAVYDDEEIRFLRLDFERTGDRLAQEEVLSLDLLGLLLGVPSATLPSWARRETDSLPRDGAVERLLDGRAEAVESPAPGAPSRPADDGAGRILLPGSFRPMHDGHRQLAAIAGQRSGRAAAFELSVRNVDKPDLTYRDILRRAGQPRDGRSLFLTREPTFVGKARRLPGCWFAIGYDTAVRLVDPAYYEGSREAMERALRELRDLGARFLVAGRSWQGEFRGLRDVAVPEGFADLLQEIPEEAFRLDISSTALREKGQ
jgi:hypothetical protein